MSYDLMVFRADAAPREIEQFSEWFSAQTEWDEDIDYNDHLHTAPPLKEWFLEMQQTFPSLNGPLANDDAIDDPKTTDYSIGADIIYASFTWGVAKSAFKQAFKLAAKHKTGFYDPQSNELFFPDNNGGFERIAKYKRAWWKFWQA